MARGFRARVALLVCALSAVLGAAAVAPASVAAWAPGYAGYHTPAEVGVALATVAADHPAIVQLRTIGESHEGRPIRAIRISDNAAVDEAEPEVLVFGRIHAREHLTTEQALAMIAWLTDGYATDARIRDLVDGTEIWIVPDANPDGAAFEARGSKLRYWRKNRAPTSRAGVLGTDLNRNFGYRWGCCGGSSGLPSSNDHRGSRAFSEPESRVLRRFVRERVAASGGRFRLALGLHSYGEQVLFPYGYTKAAKPADMRPGDRPVLRALARGIAARNGYTAMQSSALYVTDGGFNDWAYGVHRVYALTVELSPRTASGGGFYPRDRRIRALVAANREALLWWLEQAAVLDAGGPIIVGDATAASDARGTGRRLAQ